MSSVFFGEIMQKVIIKVSDTELHLAYHFIIMISGSIIVEEITMLVGVDATNHIRHL